MATAFIGLGHDGTTKPLAGFLLGASFLTKKIRTENFVEKFSEMRYD